MAEEIYHKSVLLHEVVECFAAGAGRSYIDATAGDGGHSIALARTGAKVLAVDRDPEAIERIQKRLLGLSSKISSHISVVQGKFSEIVKIASANAFDAVDGILFDLGVSTYQIKHSKRGFSFMEDAYLDMRMDVTLGNTAADYLRSLSQDELAWIFARYGEEPLAQQIAQAIIRQRKKKPITTTESLKKIITDTYYEFEHKRLVGNKHTATKTFQALRIVVNNELSELRQVLPDCLTILKPGGKLAVISFHSLEDRVVKHFMQSQPAVRMLTKNPVTPGITEKAVNPAARSAKLRIGVYEKTIK